MRAEVDIEHFLDRQRGYIKASEFKDIRQINIAIAKTLEWVLEKSVYEPFAHKILNPDQYRRK